MAACLPCEICGHRHFPTDPCWECSSGEACRLDRHLPGRPDAAPPKEVPLGSTISADQISSDAAQPEEGCDVCIPDHQYFKCHKCGHEPVPILSRFAHPEDAPEGQTQRA